MKKVTTFILSAVLMACISCGSADKEGEKVIADETEKAPASLLVAKPAAKVEEASLTNKVIGAGQIKDGVGDVSIKLSYDADNRVTGTINIADLKHVVDGVLDGDVLRCWISSAKGNSESVWRGTLLGQKTESGFEGTFALSDNGASKTVNGTWKSTS